MKSYKELITNLQESEPKQGTVKTSKYSWGTMKTVHHGADFSIPLHPEHHQAISKLKDEQEHKFKDETGRHWVARRKGEHVHFDTTGNGSMKTHVPMHTMHEEYENEIITEEDHSELARQAAVEYRKALARGDTVAANKHNAEHIRHKKAAQLLRKKSHTPGEIEEETELTEWAVKHDGVDADHPSAQQFHGKKDVINHLTKYKDSAEKRAKLLKDKGFKNVRIEESIWDGVTKAYPETKPKDAAKEKQIRANKDAAILDAIRAKKEKEQKAMDEGSDHDPYYDAQENKKSAEAARKQGDHFAYHLHMSDHHSNMAHWSSNRGRYHVADQHQAKSEQHHDWAMQHKNGVKKEEYVNESDVEFRIDHREKVTGDHKSTFDEHGAKISDTTDKATYVKVPSHKADAFKSAMKSKHGARVELAEEAVDYNQWVSGGTKTTPKQKPVVKKEPETTVKGSQIKFLNTFKEETQLDEKINLAKAGMGDVIKDFQKSDAPQFAGKTKEKRREMAIAAKLQADRQQNEGVIQPTGSDAIDFGVDKPKDTVVRDKKGKLISFKHEGAWKKSTGTITDKSGAKHGPMSQVRHLARSAMKTVKEGVEDLDEAFVNGREYASQGVMHPDHAKLHKVGDSRDFYAHGTGDKISGKVTKNTGKEVHIQADKLSGGKLHKFTVASTLPKQQNEEAPVAPVPGQKWKDHAVMVNGRQRVVIHRKNMGNYSKEDGWKEVAPGQKVKEDIDLDGNYVSEPMSYQEFAMMIEGRAQYMVKAIHNKTGNTKVSTYVADKDESEYGVRSRAEREHKPMGYSIDSVRKKDVEAHGEGDEDESVSTQKRGRGRPAGSKSGARGPRIK